MLKLIKFEFLRKRMMLAIAGGLVILGQIYALFQYYRLEDGIKQYLGSEIFGVFIGLVLFGFAILYFIDIVFLFREDLFKQEGYMLFMTPISGYVILGAKLIFALLEGLAIAAVYALLFLINFNLMHVGSLGFSLAGIDSEIIVIGLKMLFLGIVGIMEFALTVYLSFALFKSLFNNTRMKGLITFGIFIGVNLIKSRVITAIGQLIGSGYDEMYMSSTGVIVDALSTALNYGIVATLVSAVLIFIGTGYLLENKINL